LRNRVGAVRVDRQGVEKLAQGDDLRVLTAYAGGVMAKEQVEGEDQFVALPGRVPLGRGFHLVFRVAIHLPQVLRPGGLKRFGGLRGQPEPRRRHRPIDLPQRAGQRVRRQRRLLARVQDAVEGHVNHRRLVALVGPLSVIMRGHIGVRGRPPDAMTPRGWSPCFSRKT
jgi:hypothetical protein